jgi:asparagine synthase (glutamine-hydrolysing)
MCGIVGVFSDHWTPALQDSLSYGLDQLKDRGPDDSGLDLFTSSFGSLGLGHARLSIIDLSVGGHQPMITDDQRFAIVFNGEIYNYKELREELSREGLEFTTDSDTEVLLKAWSFWGELSISRLVGMFAFVVFDSKLDTLTLVRDAFGIKPLFYSNEDGRLSFGSEIRAVLPLITQEPKLDRQTAYSYLVHGAYDNVTATFFENVNQLSPGHIAKINLSDTSAVHLSKWWTPCVKLNSMLPFDAAADRLRNLFLESVRLHLRSDVPLCVNLSGGVDSSSIACAVRHIYPDIPINTVSFVARGSAEDEEVWIDIVNKHIGATSHKITLSGGDLSRDLDDMIIAQGEPFVSSSVYAGYMVFQQVRSKGFVVSLDGQGADEMLAGYDGYPHGLIDSMLKKYEFFAIIKFIIAWSKWPNRSKIGALKYVAKNIKNKTIWKLLYLLNGRDLKPRWLNDQRKYQKDESQVINDQLFVQEREVSGRTLMGVLRTAMTKFGLPALLRHSDRNSMRWSVESRVPFLTTELAEFCLGLPEEYLVSLEGETKCIFKAAMRGIVPDEILDRRDKVGFKTPEYSWVMEQKEVIREWMEYSHEIDIINGGEFIHEIEEVFTGVKPYSAGTWRMINFCRWAMLHNLK